MQLARCSGNYIQLLRKLRQIDPEFEVILDSVATGCLEKSAGE
jgi:hypothetical protein